MAHSHRGNTARQRKPVAQRSGYIAEMAILPIRGSPGGDRRSSLARLAYPRFTNSSAFAVAREARQRFPFILDSQYEMHAVRGRAVPRRTRLRS